MRRRVSYYSDDTRIDFYINILYIIIEMKEGRKSVLNWRRQQKTRELMSLVRMDSLFSASSITAWRSDDCIKRSSHSSDCCLILSSILYTWHHTRLFRTFLNLISFLGFLFSRCLISQLLPQLQGKIHKEEFFIRHFDLKGHLLYLC